MTSMHQARMKDERRNEKLIDSFADYSLKTSKRLEKSCKNDLINKYYIFQ